MLELLFPVVSEPGSSAHGGLRQALHRVPVVVHKHDGNARNLSQPSFEVSVAGGHDVTTVLPGDLHDDVVGIRAVLATGRVGYPLEPLILKKKSKQDRKRQEFSFSPSPTTGSGPPSDGTRGRGTPVRGDSISRYGSLWLTFAMRKATLYLSPSFSSSARTASQMHGMHLA